MTNISKNDPMAHVPIETAEDVIFAAMAGGGSLGKAARDEPVFVLRGQDIFAQVLVDMWAELASRSGSCPRAKVMEARGIAILMRAWPTSKSPD